MIAKIQKITVPVFSHSVGNTDVVTGTAEFKGNKYTEISILCCPVCGSGLNTSVIDVKKFYCWKCKEDGIEAPL